MGGSQSADITKGQQGMLESKKDIVKLMMPVYYNDTMINKDEHAAAASVWNMILTNTAPAYLQYRKNDQAFSRQFNTSIMYFSHNFYARLFNIHPLARDLFKDMKSQGKFLVKMISLSLSEMSDADKFEKTLIKLAEIHNERGVKAVEYGLVGEVLIWSIKKTIGDEAFTPTVHLAWIKIYSRMLKIMVPVAVEHELRDNSAQQKRFLTNTLGGSGIEDEILAQMTGSGNTASVSLG